MAILRRGRRQDQHDPTSGLDLDAVADTVLDTAGAALGERPELTHGPEPVLGYGPDAYRVQLATDDPHWSGTLVARASAPEVLRREAAWVTAVRAGGFPAPELVTDDAPDGALVFRQPAGDNLASAMVANITAVPQFLAAFGQLHARLHGLPTGEVAAADDGRPAPLDELAGRVDLPEVRDAVERELAWLEDHRPPEDGVVMCHSELSPVSVYVEDSDTSTAVAVNWTRARLAEPALDVAATVTAFWSVPIFVDNALHRRALRMARDGLVTAYLNAYREAAPRPLDDDRLRYWQAFHLGWLATDIARRLQDATGPWDQGTVVVQPESTLDEVRERFWEIARA